MKTKQNNCVYDYSESGLCNECPRNEPMKENELSLGGCYHNRVAYSLGYDANGYIELCGPTYTDLKSGDYGGAMTALLDHRRQFDPNRDVEQFVVALKPVEIILGREEDEDYKIGNTAMCDDYCYDDEDIDDDDCYCINCGLDPETCGCWDHDDDECSDEDYCPDFVIIINSCCDEFDKENVAGTFHPMNAFARARWLKIQGKL